MPLTDLIPTAAQQEPIAPAVIGLDTTLTWSEYDAATEAVARALVADGIEPGDRVAVACLKDTLSYVAVHGILRAGAVVVPIDPMAPVDVARGLLRDAQARGVIGDSRTVAPIDPTGMDDVDIVSVLVRGESDVALARDYDATLLDPPAAELPHPAADDPAYIIYTSGSTGRPKGIVHTHRSALAYAERAARAHGLGPSDRVAGIPPLHFDQSTFELYAAPYAGAAVVAIGEAHARFPASLVQRSEQERVTVWYSVPSLFRQLVDRGGMDKRDLSTLRLVLYGGEVYPPGALRALGALVPGAVVTNTYGPAELNECTNQPIERPVETFDEVPIGLPWPDVEVRIVDGEGEPVPVGEPGELLVSAPTMMQGYWRQPELTARAISTIDGRDWYATGDVAVQDHDGVLWFKGRRDNQIKLRGVRIELEAVEHIVGDAPGVAEAVVGPGPGGEHLEAAVRMLDGHELDVSSVRAHCLERLAPVAVPRAIHLRDDMPRTPSGKIDRAAVRGDLTMTETRV